MKAEQIAAVLAEIHSRIPKNLLNNVVKEVPSTPTMAFVVDKTLESKKVRPELKQQLQALKDAGEFSKTKFIEEPKIAKMIDNFVSREINKAIKAGRLPRNAKDLPHVKEMYEKVKRASK